MSRWPPVTRLTKRERKILDTFILLGLLGFVLGCFFSCRAGGVDASPYVEYQRRVENNDGEGVSLGVSLSPSPQVDPWRPLRHAEPLPLLEPDDHAWEPPASVSPGLTGSHETGNTGETQELTFETPWGPITFTLGSSMVALLVMLFAQKRGWIPIPKQATKEPKE